MEVILKKTKITTSILKQTLRSTEIELGVADVLGWCIYDKQKYIVLYNSATKTLSKFPMFKDTSVEPRYKDSSTPTDFLVEIKLGGNYVSIKHVFGTQEEVDEFLKNLKQVKHFAEIKGQFYV